MPTTTTESGATLAGPVTLTEGQTQAVALAKRWYSRPGPGARIFRLFGYAGTGKTTVVPSIMDALGVDPEGVAYAAYTGKAVSVLRTKGLPAQTIHRLIYKPREKSRERLVALEAQLQAAAGRSEIARLKREIKDEKKIVNSPEFVLNPASDLRAADLLVLDEVSMVDGQVANDLLSFRRPILVLGDPAQLPPVGGDGYFVKAAPDILMTEVVRTAAASPITRWSMEIRQAMSNLDRNLARPRPEPYDLDALLAADQVLVARNATRWAIINEIRESEGRTPFRPTVGDRVMVLQNDAKRDIYNGQQLIVVGVAVGRGSSDSMKITVEVEDEDGRIIELPALLSGFIDKAGEEQAKFLARKGRGVALTFSSAITVHKAQGSEWPDVVVLDEVDQWYGMHYAQAMNNDEGDRRRAHAEAVTGAGRWLYTSVTRASESVRLMATAGAAPPGPPPVDLDAEIARINNVDDLRRLWASHKERFDGDADLLATWKTRGRELASR